MKISEMKIGMKVKDRWYVSKGVGTIIKVLKTRAHIMFSDNDMWEYNQEHAAWLELEKDCINNDRKNC